MFACKAKIQDCKLILYSQEVNLVNIALHCDPIHQLEPSIVYIVVVVKQMLKMTHHTILILDNDINLSMSFREKNGITVQTRQTYLF